MSTRRLVRLFAAVAVPLVLLAGACSNDDDGGRPAVCGDNDQDPRAASQECAESLFSKGLEGADSDELTAMSDTDRIKYARMLCERAKESTDTDGPRPLRSEFIAAAGEEWQLEPDTLESIAAAAEPLCPDDFVLLDSLPVLGGQAELDLSVDGSGAATIEYTTSEGESANERALLPWKLRISLTDPVEVQLRVTPLPTDEAQGEGASDAGPMRCSIRSGDEVLAEAEAGSDGAAISCDLSRDQVVQASNTTAAGATDVPGDPGAETNAGSGDEES